MRTYVTIPPTGDYPFLARLQEQREDWRRIDPRGRKSRFHAFGVHWEEDLNGLTAEIGYLLRQLPPALAGAPVSMVVISDVIDDSILEVGIYEPDDAPVSAVVDSATRQGGTVEYYLRVESRGVEGPGALEAAVNYYIAIRNGTAHPTIRLTSQPPPG